MLYKNAVVAHIFLYKNTYLIFSLAVAKDQITSICTQILMQAVVMIIYGSKINYDGRKCSLVTSAFSRFNSRNSKTLMFSFGMKILHWPVSWWSQTLNNIKRKMHLQLLELLARANFWKKNGNLSQSLVCFLVNYPFTKWSS